MKRSISRLFAVSLAFVVCLSACFIPGRAYATPVPSSPDTDDMWSVESAIVGEWFQKSSNTASEGFRFQTPDITGVNYSLSISNYTPSETSAYLYSLDSVDWGNYLEDGPITTSSYGISVKSIHLLPDAFYFLQINAQPSSDGYGFLVEMTPFPIPKGRITSLKAGRKCLTVRIKKYTWADRYQIAVKKKGGKWKYYTTSKLNRTIKKLQSKKKYYVKVRNLRYLNGKRYTGKWSVTKSVRVK